MAFLLEFTVYIMKGVCIHFILILILLSKESMEIMIKCFHLEGDLFPTQGNKTKITTKLNF